MHRGSRGEEKPLNLCLLFEAYCTARKCRRKHSALLLWAFSAVLLDFRPCFAPPSLWPAGAGPAFPEFVSHFISSPHFSCKSLIRLLLISHRPVCAGRHRRHWAWPSTAMSSAAIGGARPPSAKLGHRRRSLAAICGVRPPSAELIRLRRRSAATCGTRPPSAALGLHRRRLDAICGTRPDRRLRSLAAIRGARQCSAASGGPRRLASTTGSLYRAFRIVGQP